MGYQLKTGTLLSDRYRIEGVIGHGGFSITYVGTDEHLQMRVAIKELFVSEFMEREAGQTPAVCLMNETYRDSFETLRNNFLREAIIIGIFNNEPAVVSVRDHFRENNTAYIVMEYLDGIPLSQYLKEKGTIEGEDIFRKMLPLLSTLRKIHDNEVIHRDISPDNIMVMPDQSLKLIDFGAARNYTVNIRMSHIVKDGYAPAEQWNKEGRQGPWTDIYALSATIYECITGAPPESAIQRMFFDEVKRPTELGIYLNPELEQVLWKGIAVAPEDRYQNLEEMENDIRKVIQPDAPTRTGVAKMMMIGAVSAVLGIGAVGGGILYRDYSEKHKFDGIETVRAVLSPDEEMTAKDYYKAKKIIESRVRALAGEEPYRIEEDGEAGELMVTLPQSVFGNFDANDVYNDLIAGLRYGEIGRRKDGKMIRCAISPEDIVSIERKEGNIPIDSEKISEFGVEQTPYYMEISVTEKKAQEIAEKLSAPTAAYLMCYYNEEEQKGTGGTVIFNEKNDRFYLTGDYWASENLAALFEETLKQEGFEDAFQFTCEIAADWEEAEHNILSGEYQCNLEDIENPSVTVVYEREWVREDKEIQKADWIYAMVSMRDRLDSLQVPYAIGYDKNNRQRPVVKMNRKDASKFVLDTLFESYIGFHIGTLWDDGATYLSDADISVDCSGDQYQVIVQFGEYDGEKIQEYTEEMLQAGVSDLYLKLGRYLLAKCSIEEPITDGKVVFTQMADDRASDITESNKYLFEYMKVFATETEMSVYAIDFVISRIVVTDEEGNLDISRTVDPDVPMIEVTEELKEEIEALYPGSTITEPGIGDSLLLTIDVNLEYGKNWIDDILVCAEKIYRCDRIEKGYFDSVSLRFRKGEGEDLEYLALEFRKNEYALENTYCVSLSFFNNTEQYKEELREKMQENEFYKQHLTGQSFGDD